MELGKEIQKVVSLYCNLYKILGLTNEYSMFSLEIKEGSIDSRYRVPIPAYRNDRVSETLINRLSEILNSKDWQIRIWRTGATTHMILSTGNDGIELSIDHLLKGNIRKISIYYRNRDLTVEIKSENPESLSDIYHQRIPKYIKAIKIFLEGIMIIKEEYIKKYQKLNEEWWKAGADTRRQKKIKEGIKELVKEYSNKIYNL